MWYAVIFLKLETFCAAQSSINILHLGKQLLFFHLPEEDSMDIYQPNSYLCFLFSSSRFISPLNAERSSISTTWLQLTEHFVNHCHSPAAGYTIEENKEPASFSHLPSQLNNGKQNNKGTLKLSLPFIWHLYFQR